MARITLAVFDANAPLVNEVETMESLYRMDMTEDLALGRAEQ